MTQQEIPSAVREGKPGSSMYPESSLGENVPGIPTGREVDWEPLVCLLYTSPSPRDS